MSAGSAPEAAALTGFEFLGFNHPRAASMLGIRKFIKAFYVDESGSPFGCNTPVVRNGLGAEWIHRPSADSPKRYAFFQVLPGADGLLLDYGRGGNPPYIPSILRDYLVRPDAGNDDLLLGKAFFVVAGRRLAHSYFIIERSRPLPDAAALARRVPRPLHRLGGPRPLKCGLTSAQVQVASMGLVALPGTERSLCLLYSAVARSAGTWRPGDRPDRTVDLR